MTAAVAASAMTAAATTTSAGVCRRTTDRSAMTISLHIVASVIVTAEKIDIRPRISAVITAIISVASAVTAIDVTHTSRQKNRENKHKRVTKFHGRNLSQICGLGNGVNTP